MERHVQVGELVWGIFAFLLFPISWAPASASAVSLHPRCRLNIQAILVLYSCKHRTGFLRNEAQYMS